MRYLSNFRRSLWRNKAARVDLVEEKSSTTGIQARLDVAEKPQRLDVQTSLPDITQWARSFDVDKKPWLILGKGPSYQHVRMVNLSDFFTCSLNHVVREQRVDLAHIIDIDVVADCAQAIDKNASYLALPFFPHVNHRPTAKNIMNFVDEIPFLAKLEKEGRLIWYNLSTSNKQIGSSPVIVAKFFSAESAVNILAECGAKTIRSLGVDGGNTYASHFEDLKKKTLLANTQTSFDGQFREIARTIRTKRIFYAPLHIEAPIRVFVGTDKSQMLAANVLEYSIKKHASVSVNVVAMCDLPVPLPTDPKNRPRTGFSFARFLIPSICGHKGRAIYLDADMLVFADLATLWELPMNGADIICAEQAGEKGRVRQYSVMLMNCSNLQWNIDDIVQSLNAGDYDYQQLMYQFCVVSPERIRADLPYEWNSLEFFEQGKTCLIHYTDMPTQPWVSHQNPNRGIWYQYLREALKEGFISEEQLYQEVEQGHVSPDLPQRVGLMAHQNYERLAKNFVPPFKKFLTQ